MFDADSPTSYHPDSNDPFIGKVTEWLVAQQPQVHLDALAFLDPFVSLAFVVDMRLYSWSLLMMAYCVLLLLLEHSVAFDTIDHKVLIKMFT